MVETKMIKKFEEYDMPEHQLEEYAKYAYILPIDCESLRLTINSTADIKIKPSVIFRLLKDLIGKDLSTFAMPVFVNEPVSILMKGGEFAYVCADLIPKAAA